MFDKYLRRFLNNIFEPHNKPITVPKQKIYISLPFIGPPSNKLVTFLNRTLPRYFPQIDFRFSLKNNFKIASFFPFKDKIPKDVCADIIYEYKCGTCQVSYIGSSIRQSKIRFSEHLGISYRTDNPLSHPQIFAPRKHCNSTNHQLNYHDFTIIDSHSASQFGLHILESIYISTRRPALNVDQSSIPLHILT